MQYAAPAGHTAQQHAVLVHNTLSLQLLDMNMNMNTAHVDAISRPKVMHAWELLHCCVHCTAGGREQGKQNKQMDIPVLWLSQCPN
jgi:hypothetical protein